MDIREYLDTVSGQMRSKSARQFVTEELRGHIEDQARDYMAEGLNEKEAMEEAVRQMGDPVAVGMELDRIHRPRLPWRMILGVILFSLLGLTTQFVLTGDGTGLSDQMFQRHAVSMLIGIGLMLLVCSLDYTLIGKYGKLLAGLFLILLFLGTKMMGVQVNGTGKWILLGNYSLDVSMAALFYPVLFGGILYTYRGQGYRCLWKIFLWMLLPVIFVFRLPALSNAFILLAAELILFSVCVGAGWYRINKKRVLIVSLGVFAAGGAAVFVRMLSGPAYQRARLMAWMSRDASAEMNYQINQVTEIFRNSALWGKSEEAMSSLSNLYGANMDFVFAGMAARFGILPAVLVLAGIALAVIGLARAVLRQKNRLGMILGLGCILVIALQFLLMVSVHLQLFPMTSVTMPLFSYSRSNMIVTYLLLGIVLSIYRHQDVVRDPAPGKIELTVDVKVK